MRRAILILSLMIIALSIQAQKTKNQWYTLYEASELRMNKDIRLGDSIVSIKGLILKKRFNDYRWYSKIGDKRLIEDVRLKSVKYGFRNGILCSVHGEVDDSQKALLEILFHNSFYQTEVLSGVSALYPQFIYSYGDKTPNAIRYIGSDGFYAILRGNEFHYYMSNCQKRIVREFRVYE